MMKYLRAERGVAVGGRAAFPSPAPTAAARARARPSLAPAAAASSSFSSPSSSSASEVEARKGELISALVGVGRGADAGLGKRAAIEEAQANLESVSGSAIDIKGALEGKWKLLYTTSLDLLPIFWFGMTNLTSVGDIYQQFDAPDENGKGSVKNIISAGLPPFLEDYSGLTLTVSASYEVVSPRQITLRFQEAEVGELALSDLGKTLLAPAILPRGFPNFRLMQLIQDFRASAPLATPFDSVTRNAVGNPTLLLTYLDDTLLIGRALPGGGIYMLEKEAEEEAKSESS